MRLNAKFLLLAFCAVVVFSCMNEGDTSPQSRTSPDLKIPFVSFTSMKRFYSFTDTLLKMTDAELDVWESKNSFKSFRSTYRDAERKWALLTDPADTIALLEEYKDVLVSEPDYLRPTIRMGAYQIICNPKGYFEVGGIMHRVVGNKIYGAKKKDAYVLTNPESANPDKIMVSEYMKIPSNPKPNGQGLRTESTCQNHMIVDFFDNQSGCSNDRRVYVDFLQAEYTGFNTIVLEGGIEFSQTFKSIYISSQIWGSKRNWLCDWNSYKTILSWQNVSVTCNVPSVYATEYGDYINEFGEPDVYIIKTSSILAPVTVTVPDGETGLEHYEKWLFKTLWLSDIVNEYNPMVLPISVHIEAKSRGTSGNWAIIDCN